METLSPLKPGRWTVWTAYDQGRSVNSTWIRRQFADATDIIINENGTTAAWMQHDLFHQAELVG